MSADSVVVEVLGGHDRVRARTRVALSEVKRTFTVGRGALADVILDDDFVAILHARIEVGEGGELKVSDLGTVNGVVVAGKRHRGAQNLALANGELQVGRTRLRIRTAAETLAPEKIDDEALGSALRNRAGIAALGGSLCMGLVAYSSWLGAPRDTASVMVIWLIAALGITGLWVTLWALLARVLQGEWRWVRHAMIFFWMTVAYLLIDSLLNVSWFALSLPHWEPRDTLIALVAISLTLYFHLATASALGRRRAFVAACLVPALAVGAVEWVRGRNLARDVNHIGIRNQIYPPAVRLRGAASLEDFFSDAVLLQSGADKKRKGMRGDGESDAEEEDE
ncbi:MAG: FHA domain-containing protein [Burkholderiales bacterium]